MTASSDAARPPALAVTYCPVRTLRPDPKQQIDQIVASIRQFGFVNPILADPDGRIIAGHGRLMAAKAMVAGADLLRVLLVALAVGLALGLFNGTIVAQGTHDELLADRDSAYARMWEAFAVETPTA